MAVSDAILERLMHLHPKVIDLTLGRVERLLERLGHPENDLPPVIHVSGTNGKGSVIAFLRASLEAAGYRVHVYTSPHLVRFHERIRLAGELIPEEDLSTLLEECERVNGGEQITFFEITTAAAFLAFRRTPADVLILETGLGGRLDATNVIAKPALTVITNVSLDHQQFLGDTLPEIAREKAGILKPGVTGIVSAQDPAAADVIAARAAGIGAPLVREGEDWTVIPMEGGFVVRSDGDRYLPRPVLPGEHQLYNAAVAVMALENLGGFEVPGPAMAQGLRTAEWPARFQRLYRGPLVDALPVGWELWVDGGHNEAAARVVAAETARWQRQGDPRPLHLVFGMLNSKEPTEFLRPLIGQAASVGTVTIPGEPNALPAADLAETAARLGLEARAFDTVDEALAAAVARGGAEGDGPARVLICGSLYLAGRILADNG